MAENYRDGPDNSLEGRSSSWSGTARTTYYSNSARAPSVTLKDPPWANSARGPSGTLEYPPLAMEQDLVEAVGRLETKTAQSRHARERSEEQLLAEARRLLLFEASGAVEPHRAVSRFERGLQGRDRSACSLLAGSRYWDADLYLGFRKRFLEAGRFGAAAGLQAVVAEATSAALSEGAYGLPPVSAGAEPMKAHLDVFSGAHWIFLESMTGSEGDEAQIISSPQECPRTRTDENQSSDLVHERTELVERIVGETNARSEAINPTTKMLLNRGRPLALEWDWQESRDGEGIIEYSTCTLRALAEDGAIIEFYAPSTTTLSTEAQRTEMDPLRQQETQEQNQEQEKIATCKVSMFQWTLEGSTKKPGGDDDDIDRLEEIQSVWRVEKATFLLSSESKSFDGVAAEKVLLEGSEISLAGRISKNLRDRRHPLQLQSKSVLSLEVLSVGSLGESDDSFFSAGLALRELVAYLDNIASVPNLHLYLTNRNGESESESESDKEAEESDIPSFEEFGGSSNSLGDAMKYYLNYYCSGTKSANITAAATLGQPSKFLSIGDSVTTFGAMAVTGTSFVTPIGAAVSMAALVAKDGVEEAARKGKEARLSTAAAAGTESKSEDRYRFGDVARGMIGSIRGKGQQHQECQQQQQEQQHQSSLLSEEDCSGDYLQQNKGRFAGVAVGTAGAAAGLVIAGPLGAMAGSFLGSMGSQAVLENQTSKARAPADNETTKQKGGGNEGYRFGDRARALVARGKEATGRERVEGYRFGDVSRGLFASMTGKGTSTKCS